MPVLYLSKKHQDFLARNFTYYQKLSPESRKRFEQRVASFMGSKKFIPRQMNHVTWEMKVLISASAIQLTFGFPKLELSYFRNILVFPQSFFSRANQQYHKGEVNPRMKAIVLSWKDFVDGYLKTDGRNLGLHEMAHALRLENKIKNREYNFLNGRLLQEWEEHARRTMEEINAGTEVFFRSYGGVNNEEFFAVAVENFFERPLEFLERHPLTYQTLCKLLNQNTALIEKA
ncbi:MAG: zinc-dependent peptidase [Ekhidna sp.]|nr:zinc-dependent peptidase [Ekhidna sp.]